jgi:hypothetical protein
MTRPFALVTTVGAAFGLWLGATPLEAQLYETATRPRFEISPIVGYQWGGSFEADAGDLKLDDGVAWGVVLSFLAHGNSALELTYLRQDTDLRFDPIGTTPPPQRTAGFAMNYIQIGGRQEFPRGKARPFISGSLGINVLDLKAEGFGSETRFSWSLGGGLIYMLGESGRVGLRTDVKYWSTPVPSGDYGTWCDFYGCFVVEGTDWVGQGQASGGLVFAF